MTAETGCEAPTRARWTTNRRRALALAGWTVLPYHIDEIMRDADRVAAEIVEVLSERIDRDS